MTYKVEIELTPRHIADVMVTAFEGGSNYWIDHVGAIAYEGQNRKEPWYDDERVWVGEFNIEFVVDGKRHHFTRAKLIENLPKIPLWALSDQLNEDGDANTADVILQSLLFGEVVYG